MFAHVLLQAYTENGMEVICIRHAQAESNINPVEHGIVGSDLILTPEGVRQANAVAHYLAKLALDGVIGPLPDDIYASPYQRTRHTAELIGRHVDRPVVVDYRLKEIQKGDWHGLRVADVLPLENAVHPDDRPLFRPPEGENWADVAKRMVDFITEIEERGDKSLIIVSHNHPIECAIGKLCGFEIGYWEDQPIDNASISRIVKRDGIWSIDENLYNITPWK